MELLVINKENYEIKDKKELPDYNLEVYFAIAKEKKFIIYHSIGATPKTQKQHFNGFSRLVRMIGNSNIRGPKFIDKDKKKFMIVQEAVEGVNVLQILANGDLPDFVYEQLFDMFSYAKVMGINLDYDPRNFVVKEEKLYYVGHVFKPYVDWENLVNAGIRLWVYSIEAVKIMEGVGIKTDLKRLKPVNQVNKDIVLLVYRYYHI